MLANKKKIFDLVNQSKYLFTSGYGYVDPKNTKNSKFAPRVSDNIVWININNFG
jgi:hypothetical protein